MAVYCCRLIKRNAAVAIVTFSMCMLNRKFGTALHSNALRYFMRCYFNDIVGSITFMSLVNIFLLFLGFRGITGLLYTEGLLLAAGLFWEYGAPLLRSDTVSDPFDILAYMLGGLLYLLIFRLSERRSGSYPDFTKK